MSVRKQQLLKRHRRNKRMALVLALLGLLVLATTAPQMIRLAHRLLELFFHRADLFVRCLAP